MQASQGMERWVSLVVMLLVAVLLVAPIGTADAKKKAKIEREVSQEYTGPAGALLVAVDGTFCIQDGSCLSFIPERGERYVSLSIADQSGTPAPLRVEINGATQVFCGDTAGPLFLNGATKVEVSALAAALPNCSGTATTGQVTATFANLP